MMRHEAFARGLFRALGALLVVLVQGYANADEALDRQYIQIAQKMDGAYQSAGSRVDIAGFDLEELTRQGKTIDPKLRQQVQEADRRLRQQWTQLENRRQELHRHLAMAMEKPMAYVLRVENLSDGGSGESDWFALRRAVVRLPSGQTIKMEPKQFRGATYRENYSYQCEPSPMTAVYGRQSSNHTMQAGFDLPAGASTAGSTLEISGLDQDKPGQTPIRISINGVELFSGPNGFQKIGWSEKEYAIADAAWSAKAPVQTNAQVEGELQSWGKEVEAFVQASEQIAEKIDLLTSPVRRGLAWRRREYSKDWWKQGFLRGICYESDSTSRPEHNRPWFPDNKEYIAKAFDEAGVNLIYDYPFGDYDELGVREYSALARFNDAIGTPVVQVYWPLAHPFGQIKDPVKAARYYLDPNGAVQEAQSYLSRLGAGGNNANTLHGVAIDEPRIGSQEHLHKVPEIVAAFHEYLKGRQKVLHQAGIELDVNAPPVIKVQTDADLPAWMEWQYFTMDYISGFYTTVFRKMEDSGRLAVLISQDYLAHEPQVAAFVDYGRKLPLVCTDLYNDAGVNEAFAMDLLRSVASGKAILVNGSGYSARNDDRFHRTLANGMLRADGVLTWIYTYTAKYRYRYFFIRPDMKDDRGRSILDAWRPEYWEIFREVYRGMAQAEPYLADTQPVAQIGVLYSMRSVIAESAQGSFWGNHIARNGLYTYNALLDLHRPIEACMVEGLTPQKLERYRILYLIDASCLSEEECNTIRQWVRGGGTLVASGTTSLKDEWGRPRKDYALADEFGLHFQAGAQGQKHFALSLPQLGKLEVNYDPQFTYAKVRPAGATVMSKWDNGDPALLRQNIGKGRVYFVTADRPGYYACQSDPLSGRYQPTQAGFPDLLRWIATQHVPKEPVVVDGACDDVEVQLRKKGDCWIVHLLDWRQGRDLTGLKLIVHLPGDWRAFYPMDGAAAGAINAQNPLQLRPIRIHDMIVLEPVQP
ncbi:MAG: beta-galactosidase trimerization domain-containing protein [Phycisphaerales bacterium]|jgi:hypothetical protein|nr:beta-galactosidase trimerization domain-containing protein [Phycisphaerales bacterium]